MVAPVEKDWQHLSERERASLDMTVIDFWYLTDKVQSKTHRVVEVVQVSWMKEDLSMSETGTEPDLNQTTKHTLCDGLSLCCWHCGLFSFKAFYQCLPLFFSMCQRCEFSLSGVLFFFDHSSLFYFQSFKDFQTVPSVICWSVSSHDYLQRVCALCESVQPAMNVPVSDSASLFSAGDTRQRDSLLTSLTHDTPSSLQHVFIHYPFNVNSSWSSQHVDFNNWHGLISSQGLSCLWL